jgi:class 3 adenylate cyclase/tetratricopeptide (TPR) repeat protein
VDTVRCPSCGEENPAKFRLCGFCGTSLTPAPETVKCPNCAEDNPGKFRLCGFCGTPLGGGATTPGPTPVQAPVAAPAAPAAVLPPSEVRKVVTLVFSDLKDSTALTASIDAEAMNEIKARYFASMAAEIERHGGSVEKNIGDAIMAVFGRIRAHEDDALRAVRAAAGMQHALDRLNEQFQQIYGVTLKNRTGVNTGELVVNTDPTAVQNLATGEAVNVAARLEQNAPANETLIGSVTYELVRPWVEVERIELPLKGYVEPVPAYRLIAVLDRPVERTEVAETPLVGRDEEMRTLQTALAEVTAQRTPRLVTVIGDAGVGKSRLIRDFLSAVSGEATVLRGRCLPYGDGITFWPLGEVARAASGIEQDDSPANASTKLLGRVRSADDGPAIVERLASAIGLSQARFPVGELFWAGRRFLEVLATERPVAVLVDDIHSAEKTFLDFLDHVMEASRDAPIFLVCSARHALLERYPEWGEQAGQTRIVLAPLTDAHAAELVGRLLGESGLSSGISDRVVAAADGNPLFVEQMVSMLIDKGLLRRDGGRWVPVGDLAELAVPPSIQALLASRLDDLTREERAVVEPASVIGLTFFEPAVEEMVPEPVRLTVPSHLGELDRKQFVQPGGDEETFKFRHLLIRDATYGSLLKRNRAQLHERFVGWAERVNKERGREQEFEEILGYHLEQAYRYRTELGPIDVAGRAVADRAAEKLTNAGRRAFARGDLPAASNLLRRATNLLEAGTAARTELLGELAEALVELGEFDAATPVLDEAGASAAEFGDERLIARTRIIRLLQGVYVGTEGGLGSEAEEIDQLARRLTELGDLTGAGIAGTLSMVVHGTAGRYEAAATAALQAVDAARAAANAQLAARGAVGYATATMYGPTPVDEGLRRCEAMLAEVTGDRRTEAILLSVTAVFHAMQGRPEEGRRRWERGRGLIEELGPSLSSSTTSIEGSRVLVLAGDLEEAETALRRDDHSLAELGERYYRSTVAGVLGRVLADREAPEEARRYADLAAEIADDDDTLSQVLWRRTRAMLAAAAGDAEEALAFGRAAVEIAAATEDIALTADAHADLAQVLLRLGRHEDAAPPFREALRLYERKGDVVSAARVRSSLGGDAAVAPLTG